MPETVGSATAEALVPAATVDVAVPAGMVDVVEAALGDGLGTGPATEGGAERGMTGASAALPPPHDASATLARHAKVVNRMGILCIVDLS